MKVSFWLTTPKKVTSLDQPFGGAEVSAINLAKELSKDNQVTIFCNAILPFTHLGRLRVVPYSESYDYDHENFIVVRASEILSPRTSRFFRTRPERMYLWTGDAFDQPNNQVFHDSFVLKHLEKIIVKSEWQKKTLLEHFPMLKEEKLQVIYNGVVDEYFSENGRPYNNDQFIHASVAFRGVHNFLKLWPMIKERIPTAELDIHSSLNLYMEDNAREQQWKPLYERLSKLPDVKLCEPIPQRELADKLLHASALLYPNDNFLESSCGVALEAAAAGCPVVASDSAGLAETVRMLGAGFLIEGTPGSEEYNRKFVERTYELWCNQSLRNQMASSMRQTALEKFSWRTVAQQWVNLLN